jgi:hypothetical protein
LQLRALNSTDQRNDIERAATDMSAVARPLCEPTIDWLQNILRVRNVQMLSGDDPRCTTAMKQHNHSSDDRLIQYRGKYSRHSRGQALTISRQITIRVPHV